MLATIIILSILLLFSVSLNVAISLIAKAQYTRAENCEDVIIQYEELLDNFREKALTTYNHMKNIDNKQMFEKDDDVGVIFQEMVDTITKFNEEIQSQTAE